MSVLTAYRIEVSEHAMVYLEAQRLAHFLEAADHIMIKRSALRVQSIVLRALYSWYTNQSRCCWETAQASHISCVTPRLLRHIFYRIMRGQNAAVLSDWRCNMSARKDVGWWKTNELKSLTEKQQIAKLRHELARTERAMAEMATAHSQEIMSFMQSAQSAVLEASQDPNMESPIPDPANSSRTSTPKSSQNR